MRAHESGRMEALAESSIPQAPSTLEWNVDHTRCSERAYGVLVKGMDCDGGRGDGTQSLRRIHAIAIIGLRSLPLTPPFSACRLLLSFDCTTLSHHHIQLIQLLLLFRLGADPEAPEGAICPLLDLTPKHHPRKGIVELYLRTLPPCLVSMPPGRPGRGEIFNWGLDPILHGGLLSGKPLPLPRGRRGQKPSAEGPPSWVLVAYRANHGNTLAGQDPDRGRRLQPGPGAWKPMNPDTKK